MITFTRLTAKNFLSIGNTPAELTMNTHKITCVSGENGSCKSALTIDALYYALYGKSFRKTSLPKMVNSINRKELLVELEFTINSTKYRIVRGIKPNVFEIYINGTLKTQMANVKDYQEFLTTHILKMDERDFKQLITVGSTSYVPFMQLSAGDRRVFLENVLSIGDISVMATVAKEKKSVLSSEINEYVTKIRVLNESIELQKINQQKNNEMKIREYSDEIENSGKEIIKYKRQLDEKRTEYTELFANYSVDAYRELVNKKKKYQDILSGDASNAKAKLEYKISSNKSLINFFKSNQDCPTCKQHIDDSFSVLKCNELETMNEELASKLSQCNTNIDKVRLMIENIDLSINEMKNKESVLKQMFSDMKHIEETISFYTGQQEKYRRKLEEFKESIQETFCDTRSMEEERDRYEEELELKRTDMKAIDVIISQLKDDGIKSIIIKKYMPILNSLILKYLNIIGFDAEFSLDENFDESFNSIHKENYSYMNLSEGERLRIDFAILFAFRELAKMRSSISTNILILDEADHGCGDDNALLAITNLLQSCTEENIFIISHSTDYFSVIANRNILCKKVNDFSTIKEV